PHRRASASARLSRGAHPLCRLQRRATRRGQATLRRGDAVRRAHVLGHDHAALPAPARARAGDALARERRRERLGGRARLRVLARQSVVHKARGRTAATGLTPRYSPSLMPAPLITFAHCGISRAITAENSAGELPTTSSPSSPSLRRTSGSASTSAVSR